MADYCHPEFGCDCSGSVELSLEELKAIYSAIVGVDDEHGFQVGPKGSTFDSDEAFYAVQREASARGAALIERLGKLVGAPTHESRWAD